MWSSGMDNCVCTDLWLVCSVMCATLVVVVRMGGVRKKICAALADPRVEVCHGVHNLFAQLRKVMVQPFYENLTATSPLANSTLASYCTAKVCVILKQWLLPLVICPTYLCCIIMAKWTSSTKFKPKNWIIRIFWSYLTICCNRRGDM